MFALVFAMKGVMTAYSSTAHSARRAAWRAQHGSDQARGPSRGQGQEQNLSAAQRRQLARQRIALLARLMDSAFVIPGTRVRAGLDAVLGLVPVVGDLASAAIGLFLVLQARELGASRWLQARMMSNLLVDTALGSVPLVGDVFDVAFKANLRNVQLLQKELGEPFIDGDGRIVDSDVIEGQAREVRR